MSTISELEAAIKRMMVEATTNRMMVEATINRMMASLAKKLRQAIKENDTEEIERLLALLEDGLE